MGAFSNLFYANSSKYYGQTVLIVNAALVKIQDFAMQSDQIKSNDKIK